MREKLGMSELTIATCIVTSSKLLQYFLKLDTIEMSNINIKHFYLNMRINNEGKTWHP